MTIQEVLAQVGITEKSGMLVDGINTMTAFINESWVSLGIGLSLLMSFTALIKSSGSSRPKIWERVGLMPKEKENAELTRIADVFVEGVEELVRKEELSREQATKWYIRLGNFMDIPDLLPPGSDLRQFIDDKVKAVMSTNVPVEEEPQQNEVKAPVSNLLSRKKVATI